MGNWVSWDSLRLHGLLTTLYRDPPPGGRLPAGGRFARTDLKSGRASERGRATSRKSWARGTAPAGLRLQKKCEGGLFERGGTRGRSTPAITVLT
eukprot:1183613-Prorocentrum_minimum.AAC.3